MKPQVIASLLMAMSVLTLAGCSGGSGPTAASGPFTGTWSGTWGESGDPATLTLSQTGSSVTGSVNTTSSQGVILTQSINGTASGNTATVSFTFNGAVLVTGATFTISGSNMSTQWLSSDGSGVLDTGSLASGATPTTPTLPTPTAALAGTWTGTFQSTTTGSCQWTGGSLNSPAITLILQQSGSSVTGSGTTNLTPTDSSVFSCPTYSGYSLAVINGVLSGNVLTFFDGVGSNWTLSFTGISGVGGTASGSVTGDGGFYLNGSVKLVKVGL